MSKLKSMTDAQLTAELNKLDKQRLSVKQKAQAIKEEINHRSFMDNVASRVMSGRPLQAHQEEKLSKMKAKDRKAFIEEIVSKRMERTMELTRERAATEEQERKKDEAKKKRSKK